MFSKKCEILIILPQNVSNISVVGCGNGGGDGGCDVGGGLGGANGGDVIGSGDVGLMVMVVK